MSFKRKVANIVGGTYIPELINIFFKGAKIVFYHGVVDQPLVNPIIQANQMPFEDFKKQIEYLEEKFEIISIDEFERRFHTKKLKGKEVIITFDDGYRNNYTIVAPYLKSRKIPFTVFVCPELSEKQLRVPTFYIRAAIYSGLLSDLNIPCLNRNYRLITEKEKKNANKELIEKIKISAKDVVDEILNDVKSNFNNDQFEILNTQYSSESLMNWDEIVDLSMNYNCTIGSHCLDHSILHQYQTEDVVISQLIESKIMIEKYLDKCDYFAFPNGISNSVSNFSIKKAAEIYKFGFSVNGSKVDYSDCRGYISRFSLAPQFNSFKVQFLVLSNL